MAVPVSGLTLYIDYQQSILCDIGYMSKSGLLDLLPALRV
jgi:hypothetical protein